MLSSSQSVGTITTKQVSEYHFGVTLTPHISLPCPIHCVFSRSLSLSISARLAVVFNLLQHKAVMTELPSSDRRSALSQPLNLSLIHPHSSAVAARPKPSHHTLQLI